MGRKTVSLWCHITIEWEKLWIAILMLERFLFPARPDQGVEGRKNGKIPEDKQQRMRKSFPRFLFSCGTCREKWDFSGEKRGANVKSTRLWRNDAVEDFLSGVFAARSLKENLLFTPNQQTTLFSAERKMFENISSIPINCKLRSCNNRHRRISEGRTSNEKLIFHGATASSTKGTINCIMLCIRMFKERIWTKRNVCVWKMS